jgi:hypothetical protein
MKTIIKWAIIGGIILLTLVLAIVLPLTLGRHKDGPVTPISENVNPYISTPGSRVVSGSGVNVTGYLLVNIDDNNIVDLHQRLSKAVPQEFL